MLLRAAESGIHAIQPTLTGDAYMHRSARARFRRNQNNNDSRLNHEIKEGNKDLRYFRKGGGVFIYHKDFFTVDEAEEIVDERLEQRIEEHMKEIEKLKKLRKSKKK